MVEFEWGASPDDVHDPQVEKNSVIIHLITYRYIGINDIDVFKCVVTYAHIDLHA